MSCFSASVRIKNRVFIIPYRKSFRQRNNYDIIEKHKTGNEEGTIMGTPTACGKKKSAGLNAEKNRREKKC